MSLIYSRLFVNIVCVFVFITRFGGRATSQEGEARGGDGARTVGRRGAWGASWGCYYVARHSLSESRPTLSLLQY